METIQQIRELERLAKSDIKHVNNILEIKKANITETSFSVIFYIFFCVYVVCFM